jgi:pyrroline-5-carboxylate reductase
MIQKWTFIGGGQMARAMAGGWFQTGVVSPKATTVVEINPEAVAVWGSENPEVQIATLDQALQSADAVVLAVKPNVVAEVLGQGDYTGKLVVSIAAGISLTSLQEGAGHGRVVRVMPNTPALVSQAACGYACGKEVTDTDRKAIQSVLEAIGLAVEVDEKQMDAITGLSGSGPAYVCLVIEALADGGVAAGLPREMAMRLATQTVLGTAAMIQETGRHPAQLKDAVASPGGTTIAGLASLEADGLRSALINAVLAATKRSRELGQK